MPKDSAGLSDAKAHKIEGKITAPFWPNPENFGTWLSADKARSRICAKNGWDLLAIHVGSC